MTTRLKTKRNGTATQITAQARIVADVAQAYVTAVGTTGYATTRAHFAALVDAVAHYRQLKARTQQKGGA